MQETRATIVLSTASEDELCRLAGVGPELARRIIAWRAENGGFDSVEQLAQIKGIGQSKMRALRPHVVATAPEPEPSPPQRARPGLRLRAPAGDADRAWAPRDDRVPRFVERGRTRLGTTPAVPAPRAERPVPAEPVADVTLAPSRARSHSRRALARRRLPAVMDAPLSGVEPERRLVAFMRDNGLNVALLGLAVAAQLLVVALVVWVL